MRHARGQYARRQARVRARVRGTADCPRLSVFRSLRHLSAQLIDDSRGVTLASASDREPVAGKKKVKAASRQERAERVGERLAERAREKKIQRVRFDRGAYCYHGLVAAVARGARRGGLKF